MPCLFRGSEKWAVLTEDVSNWGDRFPNCSKIKVVFKARGRSVSIDALICVWIHICNTLTAA